MVEAVYSGGQAMYTVDGGDYTVGSGHVYSEQWRLYTVGVRPCIQWMVEAVYSGVTMYTVDRGGCI